MDKRKNIKAAPAVKEDLAYLKEHLGLKTESEVLAYLIVTYHRYKERVTHTEHKATLEDVALMHATLY